MKTTLRVAASTVSLVALVACQPGPSAEEVAEETGNQTAALLNGAGGTAQALNEMESVDTLSQSTSALRGTLDTIQLDPGTTAALKAFASQYGPSVASRFSSLSSSLAEEGDGSRVPSEAAVNADAERLRKFLKERIFTRANLESRGGNEAIFRIKGDDICTDGTTTADPGCVAVVDALELRIRARRLDEGQLDLTLLVGPKRHEPFDLELRPQSLAFVMDLKEIKLTLEFINEKSGTASALPRVIDGEIAYKLERHAERDFSFDVTIRRALALEWDDASGVARSISTGAVDRLFYVRLDGEQKRLTAEANLGATDLDVPYSPDVSATGLAGDRVRVHLGGGSWALTAEDGQQDITITNIGLGDTETYVKLDNTVVFSANLNASSGRRYSINLSRDTDGKGLIKVSPEFDLALMYALAPLKVDSDQTVPAHLEDETYTFRLSGGSPSTIKPLEATDTFAGGIKVVSGTLLISTSKPGVSPVSVAAGQCLLNKATPVDTDHAVLGKFEVGACP